MNHIDHHNRMTQYFAGKPVEYEPRPFVEVFQPEPEPRRDPSFSLLLIGGFVGMVFGILIGVNL